VATAGAVARGWSDNRLPVRYVERALDEAREALERNHDTTSAHMVSSLSDAVRRRDHAAISTSLSTLGAQWSELRVRSAQLKAPQ
jgi:hypothetical protein